MILPRLDQWSLSTAIDEITRNLGSPEMNRICDKNKVIVFPYQIPGIPEGIFGLKLQRHGFVYQIETVPNVVAATEAQIDVYRGLPAWFPPAFISPPADSWTFPLFELWVNLFLDYDGHFWDPCDGDRFAFTGSDDSVLEYDRSRSGAQFKFTAPDMPDTLASTPGEACGIPEASRTYPYQQSEFRKSLEGDYASLALEALSVPFSPPESGEKEAILAEAVKDLPRYEIKGYTEFQLRAAIVHSRLLNLLGPEGPLCGYGIEY